MEERVQKILETAVSRFRGPGGAIAAIKDGVVVGKRVWGFADMDRAKPMTSQTVMPICSITKQMLCAVLICLEQDLEKEAVVGSDFREQVLENLRALLPENVCEKNGLTVQHLCDNQSGIRDYWAMSTLWGARPDASFSLTTDAASMRRCLKELHFPPGSQYSYANTNFHLLARAIETASHETIGRLISERIFKPAGMATATLCPNTAEHPQACVGYEGTEEGGYIPAVNRIEWSGDAGVAASLDDMIAYEAHLDSLWSSPQSWYRIAAEERAFTDGTPSRYRNGLAHVDVGGVATIGHGGALRGFRLHRIHAPLERTSVVVMFNHEAGAGEAAEQVLRHLLNLSDPAPSTVVPADAWIGNFLDEGTQLLVAVSAGPTGQILISYAGHKESIRLFESHSGRSRDMIAFIHGDHLKIERLKDNHIISSNRILSSTVSLEASSYQGKYFCSEIQSTFYCVGSGHLLYCHFNGILGEGPVQLMRYIGNDVWVIRCPRGLDAPAPGDWTVVFRRNTDGRFVGVTIGCWLARRLEYTRAEDVKP